MKGKLYLVATPIGNYDDITLRALNVLKDADIIVCEEYKEARRLLSQYDIDKELIALNEHNEADEAKTVVEKLKAGKMAALISDGGTPMFSDPGHILLDLCLAAGIDVIPVPGVNSLIPAITASALHVEQFYYYGWLSPKKEIRRQELNRLKKVNEVIALLDTPYRLKRILDDIIKAFGPKQQIVLAYKITMPEEQFFRNTADEVRKKVEKQGLKGEFVLLVDNRSEQDKGHAN